MHPEYRSFLNQLYTHPLTQDLVDFLCEKSTSKKHIWEIRFAHLRILLLNPTAHQYDLKDFFFQCLKRARRAAIKIYFIRGYAIYATEEEMSPIMKKFAASMEKPPHDHIDWAYVLAPSGLPYLVETYGYACFQEALQTVQEEYKKNPPFMAGSCTLDEKMKQISTISNAEAIAKIQRYLAEHT